MRVDVSRRCNLPTALGRPRDFCSEAQELVLVVQETPCIPGKHHQTCGRLTVVPVHVWPNQQSFTLLLMSSSSWGQKADGCAGEDLTLFVWVNLTVGPARLVWWSWRVSWIKRSKGNFLVLPGLGVRCFCVASAVGRLEEVRVKWRGGEGWWDGLICD